jgi:hypothetical protein
MCGNIWVVLTILIVLFDLRFITRRRISVSMNRTPQSANGEISPKRELGPSPKKISRFSTRFGVLSGEGPVPLDVLPLT